MADAGLMISWTRVVPGRDTHAVALWSEMVAFFKRLHAEGALDSFEPVLLGANPGPVGGFVLLRGTQEALDEMRNSDAFLLLNVKGNKTLEGFAVVRAHYGAKADKILRLYATA